MLGSALEAERNVLFGFGGLRTLLGDRVARSGWKGAKLAFFTFAVSTIELSRRGLALMLCLFETGRMMVFCNGELQQLRCGIHIFRWALSGWQDAGSCGAGSDRPSSPTASTECRFVEKGR